jgi:tetratricopeptide (TPR) repeat protein
VFTPQRQWSTPQTPQNPQAQPADGEVNHLKSVFTPPNQWSTPQTVLNPHAVPRGFVPERQVLWGTDDERNALLLEHRTNTLGAAAPPQVVPSTDLSQQAQKRQAAAQQSKKAQAGAKPTSKAPGGTKAASKESASATAAEPSKNGLIAPPNPVLQPSGGAKEDSPLKMSLSLMRSGDNERSLQLLNHIIEEHPEDASAHYLKAVALVRTKQYQTAAEEYNEVIRLRPGSKMAIYAREGLTKIGL